MTRPVGLGEFRDPQAPVVEGGVGLDPIIPGGVTLLRQSDSRRAPYQPGRPRNPIGHQAPQPSRPVPSGGSHYVTHCSCGGTSIYLKVRWEVARRVSPVFTRPSVQVPVLCSRRRVLAVYSRA